MKKLALALFIPVLLLNACSPPDSRAELERLRTERNELDTRIADLESELRSADTSATGEALREVATEQIAPRIFKTYVEIQGRVEADQNVSLSTEVPGTINKIHVTEGDRVKKGDVLAETDVRAMQQQLAAMQASLSLMDQMYERQKNLWDQKIGTEIQFLQMKAGREGLQSSVAALEEQIRMSKIISPIDGTVDNITIKVGQAVSPGMPAIRVVNFSDLQVEADVAESYTRRVKTGNEVLILFPDLQDSVRGKINYASKTIDPLTRTFKVQVELGDKKEFHPNMVARLRINDYVSPEPVIVLPVKYIQKGTHENYAFIEENGKVVRRKITTGREYSGQVEITGGLKAGDRLITKGYDLVNEGDQVQTIPTSK